MLDELFAAHMKAPFPPRLRDKDIADICMVMLDADIAACVSVALANGGSLDTKRAGVVVRRLADVDAVLPLLSDPAEVAYFSRLRDLAARCAELPPAL